MLLKFTKMQGAGNDFVVLDATRAPIVLAAAQWRWLADRRFGVGADQILIVGPPSERARAEFSADFSYRIFNADGGEVEQCGNGARAFARFVRDHGLSDAASIRVETMSGVITPTIEPNGEVTVDMGAPRFALDDIPFDARGLAARRQGDESLWPLDVDGTIVEVGVVSMGNPHAVTLVDDVESAPIETLGPRIEHHPRFARRVNAGFVQVVDRHTVRLRVYERGAGETLACGTGACAAVVSGIRRGLLDAEVVVHTRGGVLTIGWTGGEASVSMRGPARPVFEGEVVVPDLDELREALGHPGREAAAEPADESADKSADKATDQPPDESASASTLHAHPTLESQPS
jgi:diaminopimelate epimerase